MQSTRLHTGWQFSRDRETWTEVSVPHDWAAGADFSIDNDPSAKKVAEDGTVTYGHTGRTGGLPIVGEGWYRYTFARPDADVVRFLFDGVMTESDISVNGVRVANGHSGYFPILADATNAVRDGDNVLEVHAKVPADSARWYSGAGIIRSVHMLTGPATHMLTDGIRVVVTDVTAESARVTVTAEAGGNPKSFSFTLTAPDGTETEPVTAVPHGNTGTAVFKVEKPVLWEVGVGGTYRAKATVTGPGGSSDSAETVFGIRTAEFDPDRGFLLNGRVVKLHGVCQHHDNGALGAGVNVSALRLKLEALRAIGVNAVRTSHNPPSPEALALADEMGILVLEEFFDEWMKPKVAHGYAQYFSKFALPDMRAVMRRDRNHPCVIMWSIGNEIGEQSSPDGWRIAAMLKDYARKFDDRPVTMGLDNERCFEKHRLGEVADLIGFNYKPTKYDEHHKLHPDKPMFGSETASCVSLRGVYRLPCAPDIPATKYDDLAVNAYDLSAPAWAYYPEREFAAQADYPYLAGEFVWTGTDYLGEPTPYTSEWPARSSFFGILDTALLPKNRAWLYRSEWTDDVVLHLFPHWNWEGMEGREITVCAFTSCASVELFLNGGSCGVRRKKAPGPGVKDYERYRLSWHIPYTPGTLTAVGYDADGKEIARDEVKTAGAPAALRLTAVKDKIAADGESVTLVYCSAVDADGIVCPNAAIPVTFAVSGSGTLAATDNGDPRDTVGFASPIRTTLSGVAAAFVRAGNEAGSITLTASADGLKGAEIAITAE